MDRTKKLLTMLLCCCCTSLFAQDLRGLWQHVDDKTGAVKAVIEMRKETNTSYSAKIIKIMARPGFNPKELCHDCPAPYSNKPIIGLDILSGLSEEKGGQLTGGRMLDPFNGELMTTKAKVSSNGNRLMLRSSMGDEPPRTQVWMRVDAKEKDKN